MTDSSNTAPKQRGKPFAKGDKRINRKGRPKSFDALRALAQQISNEVAGDYTRVELILRSWSLSKDPRLQMAFIEIAFGKVPQQQEISATFRKMNDDELIEFIQSEIAGNGSRNSGSKAARSGDQDWDN